MRSRLSRISLVIASLALVQGCATLQQVRVGTLPTENSGSRRSMLSQFSPLPWAHHEDYDGALLRAPADRAGGVLWYKP